jgi:signal transduction histidine kinase
VQEEERARIARELHDDLQQGLAAITMEAVAVRQRLPGAEAEVLRGLASIERIGGQMITSTRRIVQDLRPQVLEDLGLVSAIEWLASQFTQRTGVSCTVDAASPDAQEEAGLVSLGPCLYRVAQEALNNVAKHAGAKSVRIVLATDDAGRLRLAISDDGAGIAAGRQGAVGAFGLLGMRERVRAAGGTLRVSSRPGQGTTIEVSVPVAAASPD